MYDRCFKVPQALKGYIIVIYTLMEQYICSTTLLHGVWGGIVRKWKDFFCSKVCLIKISVNTVLAEEMIHFQIPALDTIGVLAGQLYGFNLGCLRKPFWHIQL
jgi:hypothetical protein